MLAAVLSIVIGVFQVAQTGTVIGLVKTPSGKPAQAARVVLLPPNYTDLWNRQVQQRLDSYWEEYKPDLLANKARVPDIYRMAHSQSLRYVINTMQHELGEDASKYIKETTSNGQFEFRSVPFGTYQLLVQAMTDGESITWSRIVDVDLNVPIFVDLGKPIS